VLRFYELATKIHAACQNCSVTWRTSS